MAAGRREAPYSQTIRSRTSFSSGTRFTAIHKEHDHVDTQGRGISKRIDDCGFTGAKEVRENIYYASPPSSSNANAQGALTGWQNLCDPDASGVCTYAHRTAMLATDVTMAGVAHVCTASTCY